MQRIAMAIPLETIRRPADFANLQQYGTSRAHPYVIVRTVRNDLGRTRYGFSISRRLGGAVVRNRVHRRLREIVRSLAARVAVGWDVLLVARAACLGASYADLRAAVARLFSRAGLLDGAEDAT